MTLFRQALSLLAIFALLPTSQIMAASSDARSFSTSEKTVSQAYIAYYGRPADPSGLQYWAGRLDDEGGSLGSIIDAFGESQEFVSRFGSLSNSELITNIYQQLFNRDPDSAGAAFYTNQLEQGLMTLQSFALNVMNGATGNDATINDNKLTVAQYYTNQVELGRTSSSSADMMSSALASVDETTSSVDSGQSAFDGLLGELPQTVCSSSNLALCSYKGVCTDAGGYWWDDGSCNSTPQPCENVAGNWFVTQHYDGGNCTTEGWSDTYNIITTQNSCEVRGVDNDGDTSYGSISENIVTFSSDWYIEGVLVQETGSIQYNGNYGNGTSSLYIPQLGCTGSSTISLQKL